MSEFNEGIFGCFSNMQLCIVGCFVTPFLIGKNAEKMGENAVLWALGSYAAPCVVGAYLRGLIRRKHGIAGSCTNDCILHCCFTPCAVIQEAKELQSIDYLIDQPETQTIDRTPVENN